MEIKTVGVLGAGTMGNGIAHVFAKSSFQVLLCDVQQGFLERALETIGKNLEREVSKSKISRSEEHTSELQSRQYLVCRLLLEKKKDTREDHRHETSPTTGNDQISSA